MVNVIKIKILLNISIIEMFICFNFLKFWGNFTQTYDNEIANKKCVEKGAFNHKSNTKVFYMLL